SGGPISRYVLLGGSGLCLLVEDARRSSRRRLISVGQIARRRNSNHNYLARIQLGASRTRIAYSREQGFPGIPRDPLLPQRLVLTHSRLAQGRRPGGRANPYERRAAAPDSF